jgi:hypothetical protein
VDDFSHEPPGGHHLVALLERGETGFVLLPLPLLRPDHDEVDDRDDRDELEYQAGHRRAAAGGGLKEDEQEGVRGRGDHAVGTGRE